MPAYQVPPYPASIYNQQEGPFSSASFTPPVYTPGMPIVVWNAETVSGASASAQFCMHKDPHFANVLSVQVVFAGDPGAFQIDLQTADVDADANYVTKVSLNTGLNAAFVGRIEAVDVVAKFARLLMVSIGNAVGVTATVF